MTHDENASLVRTGFLVVSELEFVHRTNLKENGERLGYGILIMGVIVVVEKAAYRDYLLVV